MAEVATAYVQIVPSARGIKGSISAALGGEAAEAGDYAGSTMGKRIIAALKAVGITTAVSKLLKNAVAAGADLQQSFGGLDTLYGAASDAAKEYAMAAAQAGISANSYAEQAVSFGASLKQAFGGDTRAAMEAANMAIIDMADNSAKMGTDLASIQNAYQGFAKQNYTMLDNLKLGYGGTRKEMERLLKDASALSGVKYDISNLGDVYEAIHVIQNSLGITGVAAQEAAETLSGSFNAMKASAQNFLAALALGQAIEAPLQQLVTATSNYLIGNLLPAVGNVFSAIGDLIFNQGVQWITQLTSGIASNVTSLITTALPVILNFVTGLRENIGQLVDAGIELVKGLAKGLIDALPALISQVPLIVIQIAETINDNIPKIIKAALDIIVALAKGLWDNRGVIMQNMGNILQALISVISAINWLQLGSKIINLIASGVRGMFSAIPNVMRDIVNSAYNAVRNFNWGSLGSAIVQGIINGLHWGAGALKNTLLGMASDAFYAAKSFFRIGSPSKLMRDEIGRWIPEGIAVGIEQNEDPVYTAMSELPNMAMTGYDFGVPASADNSIGQIQINVYGAEGQNVEELAEIVSERLNEQLRGQRAVYE